MRYRLYHLLRKELGQLKGLFQRSRTKRDHGFYVQRKPRFRLKSKTSPEEGQSLPKTLIYISCGWESFKEVLLDLKFLYCLLRIAMHPEVIHS
ncbi:unnamed protein product, partial [Vitis vinifera]